MWILCPLIQDRPAQEECFSRTKKIFYFFCDLGNKIAVVTVPEGETVVPVQNKFKAHQFILGEIRDLWTLETFQWLKKCRVNLHAGNEAALRYAADGGYLDIVKFLVENKAKIHAQRDEALCNAAEQGHLDVVKYLMQNGANIHANDDYALLSAAYEGHLNVVRYLVANGADVCADNYAALRAAARKGHLDIVMYLAATIAKKEGTLATSAEMEKISTAMAMAWVDVKSST